MYLLLYNHSSKAACQISLLSLREDPCETGLDVEVGSIPCYLEGSELEAKFSSRCIAKSQECQALLCLIDTTLFKCNACRREASWWN